MAVHLRLVGGGVDSCPFLFDIQWTVVECRCRRLVTFAFARSTEMMTPDDDVGNDDESASRVLRFGQPFAKPRRPRNLAVLRPRRRRGCRCEKPNVVC